MLRVGGIGEFFPSVHISFTRLDAKHLSIMDK